MSSPASPEQRPTAIHALLRYAPLALTAAGLMSGCSTVSDAFSSDRVDYRSEGSRTIQSLEVPPDLTQLSNDSRYQAPRSGIISASSMQAATAASAPAAATGGTAATAVPASGAASGAAADSRTAAYHLERAGSQRWLVVPETPEQLWPKLRSFWQQNGFTLSMDDPNLGIMETDWAENRSKLPQDFVRRTIGRLFDGMYDSGERDRFRTRVEQGREGTEIYISHRGATEVVDNKTTETTRWQYRPADPELEAEMLARLRNALLGVSTGASAKAPSQSASGAATAVAAAASASMPPEPTTPARARLLEGQPAATLQLDDGFDRAWRRVGLALDRTGFTVEDRDRAEGLYFVRYVDPKLAGRDEPNIFQRMFGKTQDTGPKKYRIFVKGDGDARSTVSVLDSQGAPQNTEPAQQIVKLLVGELR